MRILSLSHVRRDPSAGAASATLRLNDALREIGHVVEERFLDSLLFRAGADRYTRERIAFETLRVVRSAADYDVVEITGHAGWLAFPFLRLKRWSSPIETGSSSRRPTPVLVARSYGLEHFDHQTRIREAEEGRLKLSFAYRIGGGFLTLREVEVAVAASDLFAATRPSAIDWAIRRRLKDRQHCIATGWGVSGEFFSADRTGCDPLRVAWIGTTVERKGWIDFVAAFTRAARRRSMLSLALFGTGSATSHLSFPRDIRDRVTVFPALTERELIFHLGKCGVFVSTSLSEGYHLAMLQAMAIGLPVVATNEGFVADLDGHDLVRLIPKRSPDELATTLVALDEDKSQRALRERASAARAYAATRTWARVAEQTAAAYIEMSHRRR